MRRMIVAAIGVFPIVAFSLLPKPAVAETVLQRSLSSPAAVVAERPYDDDRNRDWRDRNRDRNRDWRDRNSDRRDNNARYDDRRHDDSNWRYGNRRDNDHRVWIPGHWESGFLGIGRKWVAGHYETR